jgi:hypothetical protein
VSLITADYRQNRRLGLLTRQLEDYNALIGEFENRLKNRSLRGVLSRKVRDHVS